LTFIELTVSAKSFQFRSLRYTSFTILLPAWQGQALVQNGTVSVKSLSADRQASICEIRDPILILSAKSHQSRNLRYVLFSFRNSISYFSSSILGIISPVRFFLPDFIQAGGLQEKHCDGKFIICFS
jgi:hypothetical protein